MSIRRPNAPSFSSSVPALSRRHAMMLSAAGLISPVLVHPVAAASELTFFRIGTGPSAESLYGLGTAISASISLPPGSAPCDEGGLCGVPGLIAVAQSRAGSLASIRDLRDGALESALVHADSAFWAFNERGPFRDEPGLPSLRTIAELVPVTLHILVRADSDIVSLPDLAGRRVAAGREASGLPRLVSILLGSKGVSSGDFTLLPEDLGAASDDLIAGAVDCVFTLDAAPAETLIELSDEVPLRFLSIAPAEFLALQVQLPFLRPAKIPANAYPGLESDIPVAALPVYWVVREEAAPDLIESITRALWQGDTAELFTLNNPGIAFPSLDAGRPTGVIPVHPGAQAYYDTL